MHALDSRRINFIVKAEQQVPAEVWNSDDYHILVSDDGSADDTVKIAKKVLSIYGQHNTLISNDHNLGYGGNQKLCFRFALQNEFEAAILLHGDGQYAPELIPRCQRQLLDGADVVLGSRMLPQGSALIGGMPIYKFIGNRVLTSLQNKLCQSNFSEIHTGYRGYTARYLKSVPFERNSDEFHFDTEILIQALHIDARIVEFSIPTHYGSEFFACRQFVTH